MDLMEKKKQRFECISECKYNKNELLPHNLSSETCIQYLEVWRITAQTVVILYTAIRLLWNANG